MSNRKLKTMLSSELFGFGSENGVSVSSEKISMVQPQSAKWRRAE
jgi:hypothetical protein